VQFSRKSVEERLQHSHQHLEGRVRQDADCTQQSQSRFHCCSPLSVLDLEFTPRSRDDARVREVCELETRNPHIVTITTWGGSRNEYSDTKLRE